MKAVVGTHLVIEFQECDPEVLNDLRSLRSLLIYAARRAGASVVGESFHQFSPQGVTGVVSISESHLCIHTWPEHAYAAVDIFTCGTSVDPYAAVDLISESLRSGRRVVAEMKRGPRAEAESLEPIAAEGVAAG